MIERDSVGATHGRGALVGATVPVATGEFRVAGSGYQLTTGLNPRTTKFTLGYVHNLSKRTAVYTTVAAVRNSGGAAANVMPGAGGAPAANAGSRGFDVGLRHSF